MSFEILNLTLFWITEAIHFALLVTMFYGLYRIITVKYTPYSLIIASVYNLQHCIFNACPISSTQNLFSVNSKVITPIDNIYWRGFFGEYSTIARVVIGTLCIFFLYVSFLQMKKLNLDMSKFFDFWLEFKFNRKEAVEAKIKNVTT